MAAWPAAVAANLERFLSASAVVTSVSMVQNIRCLFSLTSFFLLFNLLHNGFYLRKVQILRPSVNRGRVEHTSRPLTVTCP
jgi:hypothetical protein